jgi:hypothetical protein
MTKRKPISSQANRREQMPQIIENTANQLYRVIADCGEQFDCIPVKRTKDGFVDKAKARPTLINKQFIHRVLA